MDAEEENRRRFEIDPDVLDKVEDKPTAMLHLWIHGRLTEPTEDLDAGIWILSNKISKAEEAAEKAYAEVEDIEELSGRYTDATALAGSANWNIDESLSHLKETRDWIDRLARALDDYKNAFERLIEERYPEIPEAIEKAELMKELE